MRDWGFVPPASGADDTADPDGGGGDPGSARRATTALLGGRASLGLGSAGPDAATVAAVVDELFFEGERRGTYVRRFATLLVLSTTIAGLGLLADSAAVVIGAMLIAPLMTPILAMAASVVRGWTSRMAGAALVLVGGTVGAIATGWIVGALAGATVRVSDLPGELLARTQPGLLDLGVAVAAGYAAGYVMMRREATSALPGTGIAVALVPPLAAVGVLLNLGQTDLARGAMLLYLTNLAAIVLAAGLALLVSGFAPSLGDATERARVRRGLAIAGVAVLLVAIPLGVYTARVVADQRLAQRVSDAIEAWDPSVSVVSVDVDTAPAVDRVVVVVEGEVPAEPAWRLAEVVSAAHGGPMVVEVENREQVVDTAEVR